jgi:hypothetical protein
VLQLVPPEEVVVLVVEDPKVLEITFCSFILTILRGFKSHPPTYW